MSPDKEIFDIHVAGAGFQAGADQGMWGICNDGTEWPHVVMWVGAAPKAGATDRFYFRFTLDGYPASAPSACPWDMGKNTPLENSKWPSGGPVTKSIFNPAWNAGALYCPLDRIAIPGHPNWPADYPDLLWRPAFRIERYLHYIHHNLNSGDYGRG